MALSFLTIHHDCQEGIDPVNPEARSLVGSRGLPPDQLAGVRSRLFLSHRLAGFLLPLLSRSAGALVPSLSGAPASRSKQAARKLVSTDMTPKLIEELSSQGRYVPAFFKEGRNG